MGKNSWASGIYAYFMPDLQIIPQLIHSVYEDCAMKTERVLILLFVMSQKSNSFRNIPLVSNDVAPGA